MRYHAYWLSVDKWLDWKKRRERSADWESKYVWGSLPNLQIFTRLKFHLRPKRQGRSPCSEEQWRTHSGTFPSKVVLWCHKQASDDRNTRWQLSNGLIWRRLRNWVEARSWWGRTQRGSNWLMRHDMQHKTAMIANNFKNREWGEKTVEAIDKRWQYQYRQDNHRYMEHWWDDHTKSHSQKIVSN